MAMNSDPGWILRESYSSDEISASPLSKDTSTFWRRSRNFIEYLIELSFRTSAGERAFSPGSPTSAIFALVGMRAREQDGGICSAQLPQEQIRPTPATAKAALAGDSGLGFLFARRKQRLLTTDRSG